MVADRLDRLHMTANVALSELRFRRNRMTTAR